MKKSFLLIILLITGISASSQSVTDKEKKTPEIKFDKKVYNFGKIYEDEQAVHEFVFYNVGTAPLIIKNASSSCDCTVPEWSKAPIMPGDSGTIKASFNPKGYAGHTFRKTLTIFTNVREGDQKNMVYGLQITGRVIRRD